MIKTILCDMLGIQYPVIQAAMGPFDTKEVAAAVSNAGGLGVVSHPASGLESLEKSFDLNEFANIVKSKMLEAIRFVSSRTDKPFGLNIRVAKEQFDAPSLLDAILDERQKDPDVRKKLKLIITSAGDPSQPYLKKIRDAGILHFHNVPTAYHAKKAADFGVDGLIATGYEAGGHVSDRPVHSMVLIPAVVEAVKVPVVAGGGICDGAGLVAALAFGAQGIYMGSRFIATEEMEFNRRLKEAIVSSGDRFQKSTATVVTEGFFGPLRYLRNPFVEKLKEMVDTGASKEQVLLFESRGMFRATGPEGNIDDGSIWCGQAAVRIHDIPTARELIERVVKDAEDIIRAMPGKFISG